MRCLPLGPVLRGVKEGEGNGFYVYVAQIARDCHQDLYVYNTPSPPPPNVGRQTFLNQLRCRRLAERFIIERSIDPLSSVLHIDFVSS